MQEACLALLAKQDPVRAVDRFVRRERRRARREITLTDLGATDERNTDGR